MNQVSNLIQWKNLTQAQSAEYDFKNYNYEWQDDTGRWVPLEGGGPYGGYVYRLVIEPDEWYVVTLLNGIQESLVLGKDCEDIQNYKTLRPAKPSEIPKPERVFKDGSYYPVIYKDGEQDIAYYDEEPDVFDTCHYGTCEFRAFSWIGEELKIDWGKE